MNTRQMLQTVVGVIGVASLSWALTAQLTPGKYVSTLSPSVDEQSADKIEKQLKQIQEIRAIDVKPRDSSLHFTVKNNSQVDLASITHAIMNAAPGVSVSEPVLESVPAITGAAPVETPTPSSTRGY
jgi:hypothetical protein